MSVLGLCSQIAWPQTSSWILLDPGHSPNQPGAFSHRGIGEVVYNDAIAALLADTLKARGYQVHLTRRPKESKKLAERVEIPPHLKDQKIAAFIALHHDSAQLKYLREVGGFYTTTQPIAGYSLFVSKLNKAYAASLLLAQNIGTEFLKLGRPPTLHHAEAIPGENRPLLDSTLGIYHFQDLYVVKNAPSPALLIEFGVLVDPVDEFYISQIENQKRMVSAIANGLQKSIPPQGPNPKSPSKN
jgi:N-acetylmuramoyl-L-alanine amidase